MKPSAKRQALRSELRRLVSRGCDAPLEANELARIEQILSEDPEGMVHEYTSLLANEASLEVTCGLSVMDHDPQIATPFDHRLPAANSVIRPNSSSSKVHRKIHRADSTDLGSRGRVVIKQYGQKLTSLLMKRSDWALAALLVVSLSAGVFWWSRPPVATIVAATEARLSGGDRLTVGSDYGSRWLELERGAVSMTLRQGVMVSVEAPARFRATSDNLAEIEYGAVNVHVPGTAHGFELRGQNGSAVDLGTGFRAVASKEGRLSVHVTQGAVLVKPRSGEELTLGAGQIATISEQGRAALHDDRLRRPTVSGDIRFLAEHPVSLGHQVYDHDDLAYAFLESHATPLPHNLPLDVSEPGRHTELLSKGRILLAGEVVDCYLLHCAPERARHQVSGSVRFKGKILGVLCGSDRLNATNDLFSPKWTLTCQHPERGAESAPDPNSDVIGISSDRHELTVSFRTMSIDQVRVLVSSPEM